MRVTWFACAVIVFAAGCQRYGIRPLFHPGPANYQRQDDAYWDPYPKNDMQDVSMNDTRPRDFDRPMSDVKRAQTKPQQAGARDATDYVPLRDAAE
ncbi:MAG TPA: hypothetical protein VHZ24_01990 [Pirellulales bacterium]|jgi:hypothetical protein|nr:hypothetical protein [Pirellulales bacterium]